MSDNPIIRYAEMPDGPEFDEFIAKGADVHFERMGDAQFWLMVTVDGRDWHINCGAVSARVKGYANCEEDALHPTSITPPEPVHTLTEYGTTSCPVEGVRANVDDGECSACGTHVLPPASPDEDDPQPPTSNHLRELARRTTDV